MAGFDSGFEGLWTDSRDALAQVETKLRDKLITQEEAFHLKEFIEKGYTILPKAAPDNLTNKLLKEIDNVRNLPDHFIARRERQAYTHPTEEVVKDKTFRLIDLHVNSKTARDIQFAPKINRFLNLIFDKPPLAFQSLTFIHGSQQGIHQDGAYVVVDQPLKFAASWVALEDVTPGSGELIYFPGSHRFEDFLFSGKHKSWRPARDGDDKGKVYIKSLWDRIRERGLKQEHFYPKKGDALIWAADLVHGGAQIKNDHTRRSLVTHYCPRGVTPQYKEFFDKYQESSYANDAYYSSRHYDLTQRSFMERLFPLKRKPVYMGGGRD